MSVDRIPYFVSAKDWMVKFENHSLNKTYTEQTIHRPKVKTNNNQQNTA
jgi:hypothetical protein